MSDSSPKSRSYIPENISKKIDPQNSSGIIAAYPRFSNEISSELGQYPSLGPPAGYVQSEGKRNAFFPQGNPFEEDDHKIGESGNTLITLCMMIINSHIIIMIQ